MELTLVLLWLAASEPTGQVVFGHGAAVLQGSRPMGSGAGLRVRIPVGSGDALRFRVDSRFFETSETPSAAMTEESHVGASVDYLWGGWGWGSGWYTGVGAGWLRRAQATPSGDDLKTDTVNGSLILGRGQALWKGQVVLEGRLDLAVFDGKLAPASAVSFGYRYHFSFLPP